MDFQLIAIIAMSNISIGVGVNMGGNYTAPAIPPGPANNFTFESGNKLLFEDGVNTLSYE